MLRRLIFIQIVQLMIMLSDKVTGMNFPLPTQWNMQVKANPNRCNVIHQRYYQVVFLDIIIIWINPYCV